MSWLCQVPPEMIACLEPDSVSEMKKELAKSSQRMESLERDVMQIRELVEGTEGMVSIVYIVVC